MHRYLRIFPCVLILILFAACRKDVDPSWDTRVFIPLVKTSISISNLVPDSLLQVNGDNTVSLVYRNSIYDMNLDTLVVVPDTITSKYYPAIPGIQINPGQTIVDQTEMQKFDFKGAEVSRIDIRKGFIALDFVNTIGEEIVVRYRIPSATKNGQAFEAVLNVPASGNQPYHFIGKFDISGYSLDLTGTNGTAVNRLSTNSKISLAATANPVTLTAQDALNLLVTFDSLQVNYAKGYFAGQSFSFGPADTDIKLFRNILGGTLDLESIQMGLAVKNGFGIDAQVKFKSLTAVNTRSGTSIPLNSPIIGQTINIGRAIETFNATAPVTPTQYYFDLTGSNVLEIIESFPDKLTYAVDIVTNPLGNISAGNDFVYYGNYLETYLDLEIPLSFKANDLCLADTVDIDPGEGKDRDRIRGGELIILADNGFPFITLLEIITLDAGGNVLDKLVDNALIAAAPLDNAGFAPEPLRSELHIPFDKVRIDNLFNAERIVLVAHFNTQSNGGQYTKVYDSYNLDLKVTAHLNYVFE